MLRKKERLTRALFDRSFSVGKRFHSPYVQIIVSPSDGFHGSVVVGKKVYKKAVDRNKLRRRLYAMLYQWSRKKEKLSTYIIIAKPPVAKATKNEVSKDFLAALLRTVDL
jgi:ribonuclease P protein component